MEDGKYERVQQDVEMNRKLCMHLMGRIAAALRLLNKPCIVAADAADAPEPLWMQTLFGNREGLSSAYIKLSQQHLKLVAVQMELLKERQQADSSPQDDRGAGLSNEEISYVRVFLDHLEKENPLPGQGVLP